MDEEFLMISAGFLSDSQDLIQSYNTGFDFSNGDAIFDKLGKFTQFYTIFLEILENPRKFSEILEIPWKI